MNEKTNRSAKPKADRYYYHDNLYGLYHQFDSLDEAKRHAIVNNFGKVFIFRSGDHTQVCTVSGVRYNV